MHTRRRVACRHAPHMPHCPMIPMRSLATILFLDNPDAPTTTKLGILYLTAPILQALKTKPKASLRQASFCRKITLLQAQTYRATQIVLLEHAQCLLATSAFSVIEAIAVKFFELVLGLLHLLHVTVATSWQGLAVAEVVQAPHILPCGMALLVDADDDASLVDVDVVGFALAFCFRNALLAANL